MNVFEKCGSVSFYFFWKWRTAFCVKPTETTWIKEQFQKSEYYTDNISSCVNWIQIPKEPCSLWGRFKLCRTHCCAPDSDANTLTLQTFIEVRIVLNNHRVSANLWVDAQNFLQLNRNRCSRRQKRTIKSQSFTSLPRWKSWCSQN